MDADSSVSQEHHVQQLRCLLIKLSPLSLHVQSQEVIATAKTRTSLPQHTDMGRVTEGL